jgi:uncharacterized protein
MRTLLTALLAAALGPIAQPTMAQAASEPASAAKKELVARVLKLQQPGIEQLGRSLAEEPALRIAAPVRAAITRLPQDKRDAVAKQIEADVQRYADEMVPLVRSRAIALAPDTLGPLLEQRFTEDELRQVIALLESPVNAKLAAVANEMQRALGTRIVADVRGQLEPRFRTLEQTIEGRLRTAMAASGGGGPTGGAAAPAGSGASGPAGGGMRPPARPGPASSAPR